MKKKSLSAILAIGFLGMGISFANATTPATATQQHSYTCPNGGISDGHGICNVAGLPAVPAVTVAPVVTPASNYASIVSSTTGYFSTQRMCSIYPNGRWDDVTTGQTIASICYLSTHPFPSNVLNDTLAVWDPSWNGDWWGHSLDYQVNIDQMIEQRSVSVNTCPNGGTLDSNNNCVTPAVYQCPLSASLTQDNSTCVIIPAVPAVPATTYTATDTVTTVYVCSTGALDNTNHTCITDTSGAGYAYNPTQTIAKPVTDNIKNLLIPAIALIVVLGISWTLSRKQVVKQAKKVTS